LDTLGSPITVELHHQSVKDSLTGVQAFLSPDDAELHRVRVKYFGDGRAAEGGCPSSAYNALSVLLYGLIELLVVIAIIAIFAPLLRLCQARNGQAQSNA